MTKEKSIFIKNIYYMLSYAYQNLQHKQYEDVATEDFDNIQDLFAAILAKGVASQIKQGLSKEYIEKEEELSTLRGKIEIPGTIKLKTRQSKKLVCGFDELSENNYMNRIIKTTVLILQRSENVKTENKTALKRAMLCFSAVDTIEPSAIKWDTLRYHRNNRTYRMLMNICYLILDRLLLTTEKGEQKLASFLDAQSMCRLYEKFILEYYRKHHQHYHPEASQIPWTIDDDIRDFLPVMQTDITLSNKEKILIIDAKFYSRTMQTIAQYDSRTLHSNNLYQIFTYVKNKDKLRKGNVSGVLLYAKTDEAVTPNKDYMMSGNKISVKTLDLNSEFPVIAEQLDNLAEKFLA